MTRLTISIGRLKTVFSTSFLMHAYSIVTTFVSLVLEIHVSLFLLIKFLIA